MAIQHKAAVVEPKIRVQLDLVPTQIDRLNALIQICEMETRKDLFNNALSLFAWAIEEVRAGRAVGSKGADGFVQLQMPAFTAAQAHAFQAQEVA